MISWPPVWLALCSPWLIVHYKLLHKSGPGVMRLTGPSVVTPLSRVTRDMCHEVCHGCDNLIKLRPKSELTTDHMWHGAMSAVQLYLLTRTIMLIRSEYKIFSCQLRQQNSNFSPKIINTVYIFARHTRYSLLHPPPLQSPNQIGWPNQTCQIRLAWTLYLSPLPPWPGTNAELGRQMATLKIILHNSQSLLWVC